MDTKQLLLEFSARLGVAGRESDAAAFAAGLLAPYGKVQTTPLGSVLCTVREPKPGQSHLLLDAHLDEIGMIVTSVGEEGFLRVAPCGGIDRRILAASPVLVHTGGGQLPGAVCSIPPHLTEGERKNPRVEDIHIDIGMSEEEAKRAVLPGDLVTLRSHPRELMNGLVSGKAADDRAGCVALLKALEQLDGFRPGCGLTVLFSSQEEVGCVGARAAAYQVNPTHAIAVDVSYAHTPDSRREKTGDLGAGPMIGFAPILNRELSDSLAGTAKANNIPFQREVMGGRTGTNADPIAVARGGVITGLLSVPLRYMHTPVETVSVSDVENTGRLIAAHIMAVWGGEN